MRSAGVYLGSAALFHDRVRGVAQGARSVDHIVNEDALLASDLTDDVHDFGDVRTLSALVDDRHRAADFSREVTRSGNGTEVGRYDDILVRMPLNLLLHVLCEHRSADKMVDGNVEEALDLSRVQIHRQQTVCARGGDQVGNQLRGDRITSLGFTILTRIAEVRNNGGDGGSGSSLHRVDHYQKLHEVVVDG